VVGIHDFKSKQTCLGRLNGFLRLAPLVHPDLMLAKISALDKLRFNGSLKLALLGTPDLMLEKIIKLRTNGSLKFTLLSYVFLWN
jgi:hypothetical protein